VPADDETEEESSLFAYALSQAMGSPRVVAVMPRFRNGEIEDHVRSSRGRLWSRTAGSRARMRAAAAELKAIEDAAIPLAEAKARIARPELAQLYDEAITQQERLGAYVAPCFALVAACREAHGRELSLEDARRADQIISAVEDKVAECEAWLAGVRLARQAPASGQLAATSVRTDPAGQQRARTGRARLRPSVRRADRDSGARYRQMSTLLLRLREKASELGKERRRAELQLAKVAREIANQDESFRSAGAKLRATSDAVVTALRDDVVLPEILAFVGRMDPRSGGEDGA
jgi:hypothetical protein